MRKQKIIFLLLISVLAFLILSLFFINRSQENNLIKEGENLVKRIEEYRKLHNELPNSLSDMGIEERNGINVIYYYKRDSIHYTVSFPISAEEHKFYYSDSKKWENGYRDMK